MRTNLLIRTHLFIRTSLFIRSSYFIWNPKIIRHKKTQTKPGRFRSPSIELAQIAIQRPTIRPSSRGRAHINPQLAAHPFAGS